MEGCRRPTLVVPPEDLVAPPPYATFAALALILAGTPTAAAYDWRENLTFGSVAAASSDLVLVLDSLEAPGLRSKIDGAGNNDGNVTDEERDRFQSALVAEALSKRTVNGIASYIRIEGQRAALEDVQRIVLANGTGPTASKESVGISMLQSIVYPVSEFADYNMTFVKFTSAKPPSTVGASAHVRVKIAIPPGFVAEAQAKAGVSVVDEGRSLVVETDPASLGDFHVRLIRVPSSVPGPGAAAGLLALVVAVGLRKL